MQQEAAHIFFPKDMLQNNGFMIGFNICGFKSSIIHVESTKSFSEIEQILSTNKFEKYEQICQGKLQIIGIISQEGQIISNQDQQKINAQNIWIEIQRNVKISDQEKQLTIKQFLICGFKYKVNGFMYIYEQNKHNLIGIDEKKIGLKIFKQKISKELQVFDLIKDSSLIPKILSELYAKQTTLQNEFDFNTVEIETDHKITTIDNNIQYLGIKHCLIHINMSKIIKRAFINTPKNVQDETIFEHRFCIKNQFLRILIKMIIILAFMQRLVYEIVFALSTFTKKFINLNNYSIYIFQCLTKQMKLKLSIIQSWAVLIQILKNKHQSPSYSFMLKIYIKLFSGFAFIIADSLLGACFVIILYLNSQGIMNIAHNYASAIHIEQLSKQVEWLMDHPMGVKTNSNLNSYLGNAILEYFVLWEKLTTFLTSYEMQIFKILILFGILGQSQILCLFIDIFDMMTIHLMYLYYFLCNIYHYLLQFIFTLHQVMNDRKFNTIKKKNEPFQWTWDQKLISIILFMFLTSILPTIAIYYLRFTSMIVIIFYIKIFTNILKNAINCFPLTGIILYFFDKSIYPTVFQLNTKFPTSQMQVQSGNIHYLTIKSKMIGLSLIFGDFITDILKHKSHTYKLNNIVKNIIQGQYIYKAIETKIEETNHFKLQKFNFTKLKDDFKICINL